jgi:ubiquinone/menaquinone biosynthesis C-methylase UbiE
MLKYKYTLLFSLFLNTSAENHSKKALYDSVGITYDATRCADPEITDLLVQHLNGDSNGKYVDICCGSGNYTVAIHDLNINLMGVDISDTMLEKARTKNNVIKWIKSDVHNLEFDEMQFDGALCISAIHHFNDLKSAFTQIFKILKPGSRLVIFTSTKAQSKASWLNHYFPFIWEKGQEMLPDEKQVTTALLESGFTSVEIEKFFVKESTQDLYLHTGKYKPNIYLNQTVRDGMTPFNMPIFSEEIKSGLIKLEQDIISGKVNNIIDDYEQHLGENVFIIAHK